jgi:hypothetical protein
MKFLKDKIVSVAILNLNDPVFGTAGLLASPEDVPKSSPFYSEQIQIGFVNNPEKGLFEKGSAR